MQVNNLIEASIFDERTLLNTKWSSAKQLMAWLRANGFQKKGSGSFGAVFIRPGYNRVIKLSTKEDKCWIKFAQWTLNVTNNPHLPDIKWMQLYTTTSGQKFFLALVEKLAPFNATAVNNTVDLAGLMHLYLYEDWFDKSIILLNRFKAEDIIPTAKPSKTNRNLIYKQFWGYDIGGKKFIMTLKSAENRARGGCDYDMHPGNLMYRPSDQKLVVIDPLADLTNF